MCGGVLHPSRSKWKHFLLGFGTLLLLTYFGSYVVLSRHGYSAADRDGMGGFYYFTPEDTDAWLWKNGCCTYLFWPLNVVDRWLGSGRHPASEPLWGLK